ncbi:MAG: ABC transporter permease [Muribaculaceae bacterium]|jgi:ABC-2 type transport system permease protein|nr:ABC transporter permease [Muribaculaceae bacterium]
MQRVSKKSFIFSTLIMPILMVVLMCAPILIQQATSPETITIGVADTSGKIFPRLNSGESVRFVQLNGTPSADSPIDNDSIDGYLVITSDIITKESAERVDLILNATSNIQFEKELAEQINDAIETERLLEYNINDLSAILDNVKSDVSVNIMRFDRDDHGSMPTEISAVIGIVMSMLLYFFLLLYGIQVMQSIVEEKSSRVLEIIVSSVKPTQLLTGKIIGIGLVAVTQILIWAVCLLVLSMVVMPAILPADMMTDVHAMQTGAQLADTADIELVTAIATITKPAFIMQMFFWLIIFLIGGFLLYSSLFAAVGSAVDNIQDASQLQTVIIVPIIIAMFASMSVANAPNSTLVSWMSMIPFTSPMVMMARLPFGIPVWQTALSAIILYASISGAIWCAAKIYRVGIFMYGKKPDIREIIRWISYK